MIKKLMKKLMKNLDIRHILLFSVTGLLIYYLMNKVDKFSIGAQRTPSCQCNYYSKESGQCYKYAPIQIPNAGTIYQGTNKNHREACGHYENAGNCNNDNWCTWDYGE